MNSFKIVSINVSPEKGQKKTPVTVANLESNYGINSDAHAGDSIRQISLLAMEDIEEMKKKVAGISPGDFAENLTTKGVELHVLPIGTKLNIDNVILEVIQIGKDCHSRCAIFEQAGDCIMPKRGIFAKVIKGGRITNESIGYHSI